MILRVGQSLLRLLFMAKYWLLKALFNYMFSLKENLSCVVLNGISVFGKV